MGFVSGMLGTAGGAGGTGFSGPNSANILNPTTVAQANTSYDANQQALQQQQQFLQALQGQNGIQNQSNVFNQLQGVANGTGPNPAQAMLNQQTGANVANQAAMMAGQRGSSSNAGLIARQAAMQGANTQQQAIGQGATMQAQQSLNALQGLGNMAGQQVSQQAAATGANTQAQQSEQNALLNGIAQQNNANVGMQSNVNSANAGLAGQTMGMQGNMLGNLMGGAGAAMMLAGGGQVPEKRQMYADAGLVQNGTYGKIDYSAPSVFPESTNVVDTGLPQQQAIQPQAVAPAAAAPKAGPQSNVGKHFAAKESPAASSGPSIGSQNYFGSGQAGKDLGKGFANLFSSGKNSTYKASDEQTFQDYADADSALNVQNDPNVAGPLSDAQANTQIEMPANQDNMPMAAHGGKVPALLSPGERYLSPDKVKKVAKGADPIKEGKKVPGKPKVAGAKNSYANDTVKATLEEGGIVLPRSVTQSKNPHWAAHKFISAVMAKNGGKLR